MTERRSRMTRAVALQPLPKPSKLRLHKWTGSLLLVIACGAHTGGDGGGASADANGASSGADSGAGAGQAANGAAEEGGGASASMGAGGAPDSTTTASSGTGNQLSGAAGQPGEAAAVCGNGVPEHGEACDDGGALAGDGCSPNCRLEEGFGCHGQPSVCEPTSCGNGVREGGETCDDGNAIPFDGCGVNCQSEPLCSAAGCVSACGDGLVIGEECDDGNTADGDGCSAICQTEPGFTCSPQTNCEKLNDACVLRVPVIYRDFTDKHPDFEVTCKGQSDGLEGTPGLVEKTLTSGVPVATAAAAASCITKLADWYSDAGSQAIVRDLVLFDNGNGAFVNRYGKLGEQWATQPVYRGRFCGNGDSKCQATGEFAGCNFDPTTESCFYPCPAQLGSAADSCAGTVSVTAKYDGTPLFFPIDDQPKTETWIDAKLPPQYGYDWLFEDTVLPVYGAPHVAQKAAHNFHFTARIASWFRYDETSAGALAFASDDDMWVFVNGKLAVDLGGVHNTGEGSLTLNAATARDFGLRPGGVYRIDIFHAERKKDSSTLRVTLPGFDSARSVCQPL